MSGTFEESLCFELNSSTGDVLQDSLPRRTLVGQASPRRELTEHDSPDRTLAEQDTPPRTQEKHAFPRRALAEQVSPYRVLPEEVFQTSLVCFTSPLHLESSPRVNVFAEADQDPNNETNESEDQDESEDESGQTQYSPILSQEDWRPVQEMVEKTNRQNKEIVEDFTSGLRVNNAIYDSSGYEKSTEEETVLIPKESDNCTCDSLRMCKICQSFQVYAVLGSPGKFHAGTVLGLVRDDAGEIKDKFVRFIDRSPHCPQESLPTVVDQVCQVLDGKYIVLLLQHSETRKIEPESLLG